MKWIVFLLCSVAPAASFGSEILYNTETRQCETETGHSKNRNPGITQCGRLTKLSASKLSQTIEYRRKNNFSLNLKGIHIKDSNLSGVDLSGVDLEGAVFENVDLTRAAIAFSQLRDAQFRNVRLEGTDFSHSDLDGVVFENSPVSRLSLSWAALSHRTRLPEGLAKDDEFFPQSIGLELSNKKRIERVAIPQAVQDRFPGLLIFLVIVEMENESMPMSHAISQTIVIPSMEARVQPLPAERVDSSQMGLNRQDFFDVLCAARFRSCLRSREGLSSMYGLSRLPNPHLMTGLEFYHGDTQDEGIGRFVSIGSIELEPRALSEQVKIAEEAATKRVKELSSGSPFLTEGDLKIRVFSPLEFTESFQVRFNFLPQPQSPTQCFLKNIDHKMKLKCKVIVDFKEATSDDPQWLQQKINHFIRSAPHSTVQIDLRLVPQLHRLVIQEQDESPTLESMAPIRNANFWTVNSDHTYSKMRW